MAVLVECPTCHRKQSLKNKICITNVRDADGTISQCGRDLERARKRNEANYWIKIHRRNEQPWRRIGPSLTVAREEHARIKAAVIDERFSPRSKSQKLKEFFESTFVPDRENNEKITIAKDKERFANHLEKRYGKRLLKEITVDDIEKYKTTRRKEGAKNATINRELALLKSIFNLAIKHRKVEANPVAIAGSLTEPDSIGIALNRLQAAIFLDACNVETRPIFDFLMASGVRLSRALNLEWSQIDHEKKLIRIPGRKNKPPVDVPMSDWISDILRSVVRVEESPYVFCHLDGQRVGKQFSNINNGFWRAQAKARIKYKDNTGLEMPKFRIHDLRHTCRTWLAEKGVTDGISSRILGHETPEMSYRYNHPEHQAKLEALNRISRPVLDAQEFMVTNVVTTPSINEKRLTP